MTSLRIIQFVNLGNPINRVPISAFYHIITHRKTHFCDTSIFSITIKNCKFPITSDRRKKVSCFYVISIVATKAASTSLQCY